MAGSKTPDRLAYRLLREYPLEAARTLEKSPIEEVVTFLSGADIVEIPEVLRFMNRDVAAACLSLWPDQRIAEIIASLPPRVSCSLCRSLGETEREAVLKACGESAAGSIRRLMQFPENTAGALMDPNPPALPSDEDVSSAREYMAKVKSSEIYYLYITNRDGTLAGVCGVRDLYQAAESSPLHQVMRKPVSMIPALSGRNAITAHPGWQTYHALPVVGKNEFLLGVISYRNLREIEREKSDQDNAMPLFFAVGEMYWWTLTHLMEGIMRNFRLENKRKDG